MTSEQRTILVPVDLKEASFNALKFAATLTAPENLHVLHCMEEGFASRGLAMYPNYIADVKRDLAKEVDKLLDGGDQVNITVKYDPRGPVDAIRAYVEENGVDMVVMANVNKKLIFKNLFGNTSLGVLKENFADTLVVPERAVPVDHFKSVLIATDVDNAHRITPQLLERFGKARIRILHVQKEENEDWEKVRSEVFERLIEEFKADQAIELHTIKHDNIAEAVFEAAKNFSADLVVFFGTEQNVISRLFLSSTTKKVLTKTNLPLLFIK